MTTNTMQLHDGSTIRFREVRCMVDHYSKATPTSQALSAERELHEKVQTLMRSTGRAYSEAMSVVLNLDTDLKKRWVAETLGRPVRK